MSGALLARKMAGSKKRVDHVAWQIEVATNEDWEDLTKLQGLVVVDVYSEWCGPCTAMASHLKEIKLQLGDDLLHCAIAKSDGINQLASFRGRSEPTWLFVAGGEPVALVRGANAPLIRTTLLEELENEKQVLQGNRQRAALSWESFDFGAGEQSDEQPSEATAETDKLPDNWTELDALVLQGSFRLLLDRFIESCQAHPLEIAHRSAVLIDQAESLILWFPSTLEEDKLVEFVESTMNELITDVEPKPEPEPESEVEASNGEASEKEDEEAPETPTAAPEAPDYTPITYKLVTDHAEKETLIQKVTAQAAEAAAAAEAKAAEESEQEENAEEKAEDQPAEETDERNEPADEQPADEAQPEATEVQEEAPAAEEPAQETAEENAEESTAEPA